MIARWYWPLFGIFMVGCVFLSSTVLAVPRLINYQGMVTDSDAVPITGNLTMRFYLYDASTGGNQLWNPPDGETQSVSVTEGIYSVQLGSVVPLTEEVLSEGTVYLEVAIYNSDTSVWEPLLPRQRISSVAYSLKAGDAEALNGLNAEALDQSAHLTDTGNPHGVTPAQIGAASIAALDLHKGKASAHHTKTTSFSELTDQATDTQIPDTVTINYASRAGNADTVDDLHANSFSQVGHTHSGTEITSKVGDADKLDGLDSTAFSTSGHNHDAAYVNVTGDSMSGPLSVPSLQINGTTAFDAEGLEENTFIGLQAGIMNTVGRYNTFIGNRAGYKNSNSGNNCFVGCRAGFIGNVLNNLTC
jgi:hypothetical protein